MDWQVCVRTLLSGTPFRVLRCTICWSTSPTVLLSCSQPVFLKTTNFQKLSPGMYCMSIIGSHDTSQGMWEWPVAVVWLLDFVAHLVHQVRLIPNLYHQLLAPMEMFNWWEVLPHMKGGWRCASTMPGGQCVMIFGIVLMLL